MPKRTNQTVLETSLMRWEPLAVKNSEGKAWLKTLSKDEENGARTALIKFDPGFKQEATTSSLPMDMFVLEGGMQYGDLRFEKDTFHYRPAKTQFGPIDSPEGCTRLVFTLGEGRESPSEPVFIQDVKQMSWGADLFDVTAAKRGRKTLRMDEDSGIVVRFHETWELGSRGLQGVQGLHDYQEEYFTIEGAFWDYLEYVDGHMLNVAGSYGCRAPHECSHGDTLTTVVPTRLIFRADYSTSEEPMNIEEAAAKLADKKSKPHAEGGHIPVVPPTFVE